MTRIRPMTAADVPLGMRLKAQAGWNQTEADWARFLRLEPDGCFVAEHDGRPVGTTTTCVFGRVGWVAMVLVDPAARGRGVGTALMRHALAFLDGRGVRAVRLDATPLGRPLYERLGFAPQFNLTRFEGVLPPVGTPPADGVTPVRPEDLAACQALDQAVTRTDRGRLLRLLYEGAPDSFRAARAGGEMKGFLAWRPGEHAVQLGPLLAVAEGPALALLGDARHRLAGRRVFLDAPEDNPQAVALAAGLGLAAQRPLLRMCRGEDVRECIDHLWASSGPEMG